MLAALNKDSSITVQSSLSSLATHVPHRFIHSNRKTGPPRSTPYEACTVPLEEQLEGTRITTKGDPPTQVAPPSSEMVAGGKQYVFMSTITPTKANSANLYRCMKRRMRRSLMQTHCKGNLVPSRK